MANFTLLSNFIPNVDPAPPIEYCCIGSHRYMDAPNSDYDVMFHLGDREVILNHLCKMGVEFHGGLEKSVKFNVDVFPPGEGIYTPMANPLELNFCFVEDYDAWKKATEVMVTMSKELINPFANLGKTRRIHLFAGLVEQFGGKRPLFPDLRS